MKKGFVSVCRYCGAFIDEQGIMHDKTGKETSVVLLSAGSNKGAVIAYLQELTGMSVNEIEEILSALPETVVRTGPYAASIIREQLERLGAEVER